MNKLKQPLFFLFLICLFCRESVVYGDVIVFDAVTTIDTPVFITALTKGKFFPQGGRLSYFFIDNRYLGKNLSGGDGYAYMKYLPKQTGKKAMEVRSGEDRGSGLMLVTEKNRQIILIEILIGLRETMISDNALENSKISVSALAEKYGIIYLANPLGMTYLKQWLEKEKFFQAPVLLWRGPELILSLKEKGLKIHAIIGSANLISEASDQVEHCYSFEETEDGKTVEDWKDILESLGS